MADRTEGRGQKERLQGQENRRIPGKMGASAMRRASWIAERNKISDLPLEEINAESAAARREKSRV